MCCQAVLQGPVNLLAQRRGLHSEPSTRDSISRTWKPPQLAAKERLPASTPLSVAIRREAVAHPGEGARILSLLKPASAVYGGPPSLL